MKWNRRAKWGLACAFIWAIFNLVSLPKYEGDFLPLVAILSICIPLQWALLYGCWSLLLWLLRLVTRPPDKPLWNRRVTLAALLSLVLTVANVLTTNNWARDQDPTWILAGCVIWLSATCFFYGVVSGLTSLWHFSGLGAFATKLIGKVQRSLGGERGRLPTLK